MTISPSNSAKQAKKDLGSRMREVRKDAGLTGRRLAELTGQHYTRVSKIENGAQVPTDGDIRAWCGACGAEDLVPELTATARAVESAYQEFRRMARAGLRKTTGPHTDDRYFGTRVFRIYEHNAIPALFQTKAYCAARLSFWADFLGTTDSLEAAIEDRMLKQHIVGTRGIEFRAIIEEQALRTWFGTAQVQSAQLGRLLEILRNPVVRLGIIPLMTERSGIPSAGFWVFDDQLVALETPTAAIEVTRPDEIGLYLKMFALLEGVAVYGDAAQALIVRALSEISAG